jgi:hypothetical protein
MNGMGVSMKMSLDSAKPDIGDVIYWPPQAQGLTCEAIKQAAIITRILREPMAGTPDMSAPLTSPHHLRLRSSSRRSSSENTR